MLHRAQLLVLTFLTASILILGHDSGVMLVLYAKR